MEDHKIPNIDRSVQIGGDVTGGAVVTGDINAVSVQVEHESPPQPEVTDIQEELKVIQGIFANLNDPVTTGVAQKLGKEAHKSEPDKSVVATTLETGLTYAQNLSGFAEEIDKLRSHVKATAG